MRKCVPCSGREFGCSCRRGSVCLEVPDALIVDLRAGLRGIDHIVDNHRGTGVGERSCGNGSDGFRTAGQQHPASAREHLMSPDCV